MNFQFLRGRHWLLLAVLLAFMLAVNEGPQSWSGRLFWVLDAGLFLLWQPLVNQRRHLSPLQIALVLGGVSAAAFQLAWVGLAVWGALLTALVGGKVVVSRGRRGGWFYLLAFAFLAFVLFAWVSPRVVKPSGLIGEEVWVSWLAVWLWLTCAVLMPSFDGREEVQVFDFLISLLILLLVAVVMMRAHALVIGEQLPHSAAMFRALLELGGALLLLAWVWNPRLGFSGLGVLASRYLLRLGFPFDEWLERLTQVAEEEAVPARFMARAAASFGELPWVTGGRWQADGASGAFGDGEVGRQSPVSLSGDGVEIELYTTYRWSAALVWQAHLLFRLVREFYRAKLQERQLQKMRYLQAVHETGSRVTHDVKNILQSLDGLCFALSQERSAADAEELAAFLRTQLPSVRLRLRQTLDKLVQGGDEAAGQVSLSVWWNDLRQRYAACAIRFSNESDCAETAVVNLGFFDGVADNLLGNALQKQLENPTVEIRFRLFMHAGRPAIEVSDSGAPVSSEVMVDLFQGPVPSRNGLGIGLYHAAESARLQGYSLSLADNRAGRVLFRLLPASSGA